MSFSKSRLAFDDIRAIFERALLSENGLKVHCETHGAAINLRSRFNYFRKLDRRDNKELYEKGHKMYGNSIYDTLTLKVPGKFQPDSNVLTIEHLSDSDNVTIEEVP